MCLIEIHTYPGTQGVEQRIERTRLCRNSRGNETCNHVRRQEYNARLEERRPAGVEEDSSDIIIKRDKSGREVKYRRVSRAEEKLPVRLSPRVTAPSPPRRHTHILGADTCPRSDCPLGRDLGDISPLSSSYNDFLQALPEGSSDRSRPIRTTIRVPPDLGHTTPILSTPPPPRKKILKPDHRRQDSGKGFTTARRAYDDPMEGPSEPRRVRIDDSDNERRALNAEKARLDSAEARRLQAVYAEEARLARLEQERYAMRDAQRASSAEAARLRQIKSAEEEARRKAQQNHEALESDNQHARRQRGEERAREEERLAAQARDSERRRSSLVEPSSPSNRRLRAQRAVIHYETAGDVVARDSQHIRTASDNIILREQLRLGREERAAGRSPLDDPLRDMPPGIEERGISEYAVSETEARRARIRRYREEERRRHGEE